MLEYNRRARQKGTRLQCGGRDRLSQGQYGDLRQDDIPGGPGR